MQQVPREIGAERRPVQRQEEKKGKFEFALFAVGRMDMHLAVQHSSLSMGWKMAAALGDREQHPPPVLAGCGQSETAGPVTSPGANLK